MAKYDTNILCPLLLQVFFHLNHVKALAELEVVEDDDFFFPEIMLNDDAIISILKKWIVIVSAIHYVTNRDWKPVAMVGK